MIVNIPHTTLAIYVATQPYEPDPVTVYAQLVHNQLPPITSAEYYHIQSYYQTPTGLAFEILIKEH